MGRIPTGAQAPLEAVHCIQGIDSILDHNKNAHLSFFWSSFERKRHLWTLWQRSASLELREKYNLLDDKGPNSSPGTVMLFWAYQEKENLKSKLLFHVYLQVS